MEGECANLRCFCESVPRLLARIVELRWFKVVFFLPYDTIIATYDESFIFYWFPRNRGYYSKNTGIILFLDKAGDFSFRNLVVNVLECGRLATCTRNFAKKICTAVLE